MNVVVVISVLAGISAAGFVWFGWDLIEAFLRQKRVKRVLDEQDQPDDSP